LLQLPVSINSPTNSGDQAPHQPGVVCHTMPGASRSADPGNSRLLQVVPKVRPIAPGSAQTGRGDAARRRAIAASRATGESSTSPALADQAGDNASATSRKTARFRGSSRAS
jgi:hypothetical protein